MRIRLASLLMLVAFACLFQLPARASVQRGTSATPPLMTPADLQSLPARPADHRLAYGDDSNQIAELRLPSGSGPHPVVVLIHGGCWKAEYATLRELAPIGDALKAEGIASWNVEYRRLGQPGSGWPGPYIDIGRAIDHLRQVAPKYSLDLASVAVVGHSADSRLGRA
jgi:acetyl esterase/lipase